MVTINCDMGESFGIYKLGDDELIMPYITHANIACGFHSSDPNHMERTVKLAKKHKVQIGAHFSLPDLTGFGRREMKIDRQELKNIIVYQIGALNGFLQVHDIAMSHLKPHGSLYGMAAKYEHVAHAVADAAEIFNLPVMGMSGTLHDEVFAERNITMIPEFFSDLDYDDNGGLIISREHGQVDPKLAAERCALAVREGKVKSVNGKMIDVKASTICIHSDTAGADEIAKAIREMLELSPA